MKATGRYEIRGVLGEGGMGIVYRAFDLVMNREVTVKTIRDSQDKAVLELFKRECAILASLSHPNIVEIFDIGETEEAGAKRPYFVMPLLKGETFQKLIETSSPRLTVERCIQMIAQACRGLQAAHDQGLVHRDLKPSNLFALNDDSVKIIDFGVAHLANQHSATGMKGTLPYMAPEQLLRKQPSPLSDQFSLGVVCYEMLARRRPFNTVGDEDVAQAILNHSPAPVSELNPLVSPAISQVIHAALAKEPFYRFANVREFSECLQKALRGEPIDKFDPARIAPRLQRARKAFGSGDLDDASEVLTELESANYLVPEIRDLRRQIDREKGAKIVKQLLETARRRFDEGEYVRALQKVQEVLNLDPNNTEAFTLKGAIETRHSATQIDEWFRLAFQHMENHAYVHARQALEKVLDLRPKDPRAQDLLAEVERREQEYVRLRNEKQQVYESALDAYKRGDLNSALNKLDRLLDLDRRAPSSTSPEQGATYQKLYEAVRSKRDQVSSQEAEARRHLNESNFAAGIAICDEILATYPNNVVFHVLRDDIEQAQRQELSAYIAKIEKEAASEPDFNRKVSILEEARQKYPAEQRFEQSLQQVRSRRDLVDSIVGRARTFEEARQFTEALGQWEIVRNIHPKYPGLEIEIERLKKRREQQARADAKAHWVTQIDQALAVHNYAKATSLIADASAEFPGDVELAALAKQTDQAQTRAAEGEEKANRGKELYANGHIVDALELLREAAKLNPHSPMVRSRLLETLLREARNQVDGDWHAAEQFIQEALDLDSSNREAKSLNTQVQDKRQEEDVSVALSTARELQSAGKTKEALNAVEQVLVTYPRENRLVQFQASLLQSLSAEERQQHRARDLEELNKLVKESKETNNVQELESIFMRSSAFSKYAPDPEFRDPLSTIEERLRREQEAAKISNDPSAALGAAEVPLAVPTLKHNEEPNVSKEVIPKRRVPALSGLMKNVVWTAVSFMAIAVSIWFVLHPLGRKGDAKTPSILAGVEVRNAIPGEYKIIRAADGTDVSANLLSGLPAGSYRLVASRTGLQTVELRFSLDPSKEPRTILEVKWQALPADVRIVLERAAGSLMIDGIGQPLNGSTVFNVQWRDGSHSVLWQASDADSVELQFDVGETIVLKNPVFRGSVFGIAAVLSKTTITYQSINIPGGVTRTVDGQVETLPSSETFPVQGNQLVGFKVRHGGYPLGSFQADPTGPPVVYVRLANLPRNAGGNYGNKKVEPPPVPKPIPITPDPAKPTEEELRQKEREAREVERQKYRDDNIKK